MGVSGSGKTTVGRMLAAELDVPFVDGDDLHPSDNVRRMASGLPLTDHDRGPWLDAVRREIEQALSSGTGLVVACSALKLAYREHLMRRGEPTRLVHLSGSRDLIAARMRRRFDHFMPTALLDSQFMDLEPPEDAIEVDIRGAPANLVKQIVGLIRSR